MDRIDPGTRDDVARRIVLMLVGAGLALQSAGCSTAPMETSGYLKSYDSLTSSNSLVTKTRLKVRRDAVLNARTVRIVPTNLAAEAARTDLTETERRLVTNAIDRALCLGLSDRFEIVLPDAPADLTVRAAITHIGLTDRIAAGGSRAVAIGTAVVTKLLLPVPVPVPTPRIPIGLGGLSVEAEAIDRAGIQQAALLWARGADAMTSKPKVSAAGDAYDLAAAFGNDFSRLLVSGADPVHALPELPSLQRIAFAMGSAPQQAACEMFGRSPGVPGLLGDTVGLPPDWTDVGPGTPARAGKPDP